MHADERNRAMSEKLGEDVYHYHLHVVYIPVVEKEVRWTKRCKNPALVGTVKERIHQVSMSKKWASQPAIGEDGQPLLTKSGKPVLKKSYSVLQDEFYNAMRSAGYTDLERGERGSSEEHLTVTQFKVEREKERLEGLTEQTAQKAQEAATLGKKIERYQKQQVAIQKVDAIEAKPVPLSSTKVILERKEYDALKATAKKYIAQEKREGVLQKALDAAKGLINKLKAEIASLREELSYYRSPKFQMKLHHSIRFCPLDFGLVNMTDNFLIFVCYDDGSSTVGTENTFTPFLNRKICAAFWAFYRGEFYSHSQPPHFCNI